MESRFVLFLLPKAFGIGTSLLERSGVAVSSSLLLSTLFELHNPMLRFAVAFLLCWYKMNVLYTSVICFFFGVRGVVVL